jgi:hypothetical protein
VTLPNFLCVGVSKAGTTTLYDILRQHPEIFLSPTKEIKFFNIERNYRQGPEWYARFFEGHRGEPVVGEMTPGYIAHPEAAGRIRACLGPEVRILISLRNPVDRAISHYLQNVRNGHEDLTFEAAIEAEPERVRAGETAARRFGYLARGHYAEQVARYLETFGRDPVKVILFEEAIRRDRAAAVADILDFLGVRPVALDTDVHSNPERRAKTGWRGLVRGFLAPKRRIPPELAGITSADFGAAFRRSILDRHFAEEIETLERMLGRGLDPWRQGAGVRDA